MKIAPTSQKLRGGYYTPKPIADFLARWAIQSPTTSVLEPSCGDGSLLEASIETLLRLGADRADISGLVQGVELDPEEAAKTEARIRAFGIGVPASMIHVEDFFTFSTEKLLEQSFMGNVTRERQSFDAIIGNPPFIRYQTFPEEYRDKAVDIMKSAGMKPSRLMNSWLPFLVASSLLLKENGRLAMVIPAELFQVHYAAETRLFLSNFYNQITIVTFKRLIFVDIQQEVVLLLCQRGRNGHNGIRVIESEDAEELATHVHTEFIENEIKSLNHSKEKWTQYFLTKDEIQLLRNLRADPHLVISGSIFSVDVGVVTGENKFFILNEQQRREADLEAFTSKIVSRSGHLQGTIFALSDWQENANKQFPAFLLNATDLSLDSLPEPLKMYISQRRTAEFSSRV